MKHLARQPYGDMILLIWCNSEARIPKPWSICVNLHCPCAWEEKEQNISPEGQTSHLEDLPVWMILQELACHQYLVAVTTPKLPSQSLLMKSPLQVQACTRCVRGIHVCGNMLLVWVEALVPGYSRLTQSC